MARRTGRKGSEGKRGGGAPSGSGASGGKAPASLNRPAPRKRLQTTGLLVGGIVLIMAAGVLLFWGGRLSGPVTSVSGTAATGTPAPATTLPAAKSGRASARGPIASPPGAPLTVQEYLAKNHARYEQVMSRMRQWLDNLKVDPFELREHEVKGKTKLVEILDTYLRLYRMAQGPEKERVLTRVKQLAAVTFEPRYHDMQTVSDKQFHQDSTSYLRAAYILEKYGLDTSNYRKEIVKILPRLAEQMPTRGAHQKMVFEFYYKHFGLEYPLPPTTGLAQSHIKNRKDPAKMDTLDIYGVTHEVFVPFDYGDDMQAKHPFDEGDLAYLRSTLQALTERSIRQNNHDLAAELVSCIVYLRMEDLPVYTQALDFLLAGQNPDGTYGRYERHRARLGELVGPAYYLHTVLVVVDALTAAFMDRSISPPW